MTAKANGKPPKNERRRIGSVGQAYLDAKAAQSEKTKSALRKIAGAK